uniref:Talin 2 n=1 Tax=Echinococcus granulosus TaxID=6210 RepID=A0A068WXT2_ECHGR|nr:talin 2 [Echinococcus granulosus]
MAIVALDLVITNLNKRVTFKTPLDITVFDLCRHIQSNIKNAGQEYGIFVCDSDPKHSFWLESSRLLSYYHLQDGMEVTYKSKLRRLVVSTLDGTRKTLQVDDSKTIADLMVTICGKMGITNHEEYSLIHEKGRAQTLRRPKNAPRDYDKMETLKHKLQTDDGANWLPHAKTFRQLGIEETDNLLLQRKYFFSDQNVGARDPVQLNLLFIQLKEAILNGAHPISLSQAIELAGLQCQAEMGNLIPEKAKSLCIDVKEHLPKEYVKVKGIEKKIKEQYQKLNGLSEKDAKVRYIQVCRSLPTYGITFFLIKEKLPGKNKLVPRLFGVSKESVMRVDENTKEILQTWPLTRVRRWAATANLFTLDFGEYSPDGNYVMQTTEGEQISQLISGYIDIILRRKKKSDAFVSDSDDSNVIFEENVGPSRAEIISNVGTVGRRFNVSAGRVATEGYPGQASTFTRGYVGGRSGENIADRNVDSPAVAMRVHTPGGKRKGFGGNEVQLKELSQPKRAVMHRIDESTKEIQDASDSLQKPYFEDNDTVSRDDSATQRWREENMAQARAGICSYLGAMTIATGNLVSLLQPSSHSRVGDSSQEGMEEEEEDAIDYTAMDASLATIGLNVQRLMQNVRVLDQLQAVDAGDESQGHIMNAAQDVADAFLKLMQSAMPLKEGKQGSGTVVDRPSLYEAASRVGDTSQQLLQLVSASHLYSHRRRKQRLEPILEDDNENDQDYGDYESDLEIIANAHAMDWQLRDDLLAATKEVASTTANLVKHAKSAAVAISQEATVLAHTETDSVEIANQRDDKVAFLRDAQSHLVQAATHAGKTTSRLVTSAKVAVCTMEQPASQRQLLSCVKQVGQAVDQLSDVARRVAEIPYLPLENMEQRAEQQRALSNLHHAANTVSSSLDSLMNRLVAGSIQAQQDPVVLSLLGAGEQLTAALGDGDALFQQASRLAQTATALVEVLKNSHDILGAADISKSEVNLRANLLSQAITDLLESLKSLESGNKQSLPHQQETIATANRLIEQTNKLAAPIIRARLTTGLEFATRLTASNASQLAAIMEEAARHTRSSQYRLLQELDQLSAEVIPQANLTCDSARAHPHDPGAQNSLLEASKDLMDCLKDFIGTVDMFAPTVTDAGIQVALTNAARNTEACLVDLRQCCATASPLLQSPLPTLTDLEKTPNTADSAHCTPQTPAVVKRQAWPSISSRLARMQTELDSNSDHSLPGQTMDSVCGNLLAAINKFKAAPDSERDSSLPDLLAKEAETIASGSTFVGVGPDRLPPVTAKLLNSLESVISGIRGLAGFLSSIKDLTSVDPELEKVLISSWNLLPESQRSQAGRRFVHSPSQEFSAQLAADGLRAALLDKGLQCIEKAHASLLWAVHEDESYDTAKQAVVVYASELQSAIDEVRHYVPGAQSASKLGALVAALPKTVPQINGQIAHTPAPVVQKTADPSILLRALRELAEASEEVGRVACEQTSRRRADESAPSSTCSLAMAADRLANALYDVLDVFNRGSRPGSPNEEVLADLQRLAKPLATELERALASEGVVQTPVNVMFVSKASLSLRNWAIGVTKATQEQLAKDASPQSDSTKSADQTMESIRGQFDSALARLQPPPGAGNDSLPLISYPVAKLTYPECIDELDDLSQTLSNQMDGLEESAKSRNANAFCEAAQGVADAVMGMLQVATQSAYLVGAGQPCNEPGRAPRLTESEARQVVEDSECLQRGIDVITREALTFVTNQQRASHLAPTVNEITRASSNMCQLTRQCIAESINSSEKKMLAENAKDVAQTTTHLVKSLSTDNSDSPSTGAQVVQIATGLNGSIARLASSLLEDVGDIPVQVLPEAAKQQAPILLHGRKVVEKASDLTETAGNLLKATASDETYRRHREDVESAAQDLRFCICDSRPGWKALEKLKSTARESLHRLDHAGLQQYSQADASNLEATTPLLNSSLRQVTALSGKLAGDWRHSRWELLSQDAHLISSYLPNVANVCISACGMLKRSSDQAALQSYLRTVLETTDALATRILTQMDNHFGGPPDPDPSPISASADQLRLACRELLICIEDLTARQGNLNSQIASIQGACKKLESNASPPHIPQQISLVALQTRLASQAQMLVQAGGRLSEASKTAGSGAEEAAASQLVQQFSKTVETTQQLSSLLTSHPSMPGSPDTTSRLADRLRMVVQGIGTSCVEVVENSRHPESLRSLTTRVSSLVAVLRESAHGVHACVNAAEGIARKVADFDSAIYFARANSLVNRSCGIGAGQFAERGSPTAIANDIQASQEEIMHLLKGIVEETNALSRNTSGDQDKLAVSAQNCLLYVNNLHTRTLHLLSHPDLDTISPASEEARTEARVSLLSMARAVSASLIDLLTHSRNLVTAEKANLPVVEAQLNSTAADVVSRVGELRSSLRSFSEVFVPPRPVSNVPKLTPITKSPRTSSMVPTPEDSATASVRTGLQSVLATVHQLATRLNGWSPETGTFSDGDTIEFEREVAANDVTTPRQIQEAALGITQAALKANSATAAGRKLADISVAGEVIHKAANDLVRRLRCGTCAVVLATRKTSTTDGSEFNAEKTSCAQACSRAIEGGKSTLQELGVMVENMIKSLDDPGSGQPPAMQVTLAMRRLRETVYEIVEGVKQMPGGRGTSSESDTPSAVFRQRETTEIPRPISQHKQPLKQPVLTTQSFSKRSELALSIKEAANIATDVGDAAGTEELRGFTSEIEQSMEKLTQLQSKAAKQSPGSPKLPTEDDENDGLEGLDAILATCKRLAQGTASLMHWATAAQRELVKQGRLKPVSENVDESEAESQWTCGLVSAARYVSAATVHLVEAAETLVAVHTNDASADSARPRFAPEDLVSAARTVVSNTGQLIFACLAKADANSASMRGLNATASAVRRHAERLIELTELEKAKNRPDEPLEPSGPRKATVEAMREVIETKASIASKMAELERLQNRLKAINQESYHIILSSFRPFWFPSAYFDVPLTSYSTRLYSLSCYFLHLNQE